MQLKFSFCGDKMMKAVISHEINYILRNCLERASLSLHFSIDLYYLCPEEIKNQLRYGNNT